MDTPPTTPAPVPAVPGAAQPAAAQYPAAHYPAAQYPAAQYPVARYGGAPVPPAEPSHNVLAWVSLGLGCAFLLFGTLASIAAVVCGHIARRQIRQRGEQGDSAAVWGLVLGYFGIALSVLVVVFFVLLFVGAFALAGVGQQL